MSADISPLKAALRRQLRVEMKRHSPAERAALSEQICERLKQQAVWQKARSILFYFPRPDEPDIRPLVTEGLVGGKTVALPRYWPEPEGYVACQIQNMTSDLGPGQFGIAEPVASCSIFDLNKLDFFLVPGLGFAFNGYRLGRGKGYYDRLLARVPGVKCGVGFDWQLMVEVPLEPHDVHLDCILTPTRWHEVAGPRRF
jgi:5-formyltetrahydrofolate cyclo-ligase